MSKISKLHFCGLEPSECGYRIPIDMESHDKMVYQQGRADELDKISKMMLLGCDELKCEECDYRLYSQDVCQQAYTIGIIENYIAEQLKENDDEV